ncbi:MAG: hypothetical protein KKA22_11680 [Gammaproteobacteria bacterium]|nr:hypothetical protein [Gammaproteobacteria bacterium]MBU1408796.1 hypothetical protein [Gammaproteobacteria bacterium]MBU1532633.1 hypothetical protein [Gammaproteobacteria bacterium]
MDKQDRQDFTALIEQAESCTRARDFRCSDNALAKAGKLPTNNKDRKRLQLATANLQAARQQVQQEEYAAVKKREAEKTAALEQQQAERKRRRREEEAAWDRERQADAARSSREIAHAFDKMNRDLSGFTAQQNRQMQRTGDLIAQNERSKREAREQEQARAERDRQAARAEADRAQAHRDAQLRADTDRRESEARERERQQQADATRQEADARRAQQESDRLAEAKARAGARDDYLSRVAGGTRLMGKTCFGEQHVLGTLPQITPRAVACVDVHFRAYCPGSSAAISGVIRNMQGMKTGCYGDTARIGHVACQAEALRVEVVAARACE